MKYKFNTWYRKPDDCFYMWNGINHLKSLFCRHIMSLCPFVFQHHSCCDNSRRGRVSPEGRISAQLHSSRGRGQLIIVPSSPGTRSVTVCTPVERKCSDILCLHSIKYEPFYVKHAWCMIINSVPPSLWNQYKKCWIPELFLTLVHVNTLY